MSALADNEPILHPGDVVIAPCDICKRTGVNPHSHDELECWRCEGNCDVMLVVAEPEHCPGCDVSLQGGQIALTSMASYGNTHFSNKVAITRWDRTSCYHCRDCKSFWKVNGELIDEATAMSGSREELGV